MKSQKNAKCTLSILAVALIAALGAPTLAGPPLFSASIDITADPGVLICVGDTVTLTVNWSTNDQNVTRSEWSVDGVGQGVVNIDASSGTSTFTFTGTSAGSHVISFRIWHHQQTQRDASNGVTITVQQCQQCEWRPESAWAAGTRYVTQGNWATYTPYVAGDTVTLYAGQTLEAGAVHFSAAANDIVTITITLNSGWRFADVLENVKIQDYSDAPSGNPSPGQFDWKGDAGGSSFDIEVPANSFYGVHVDVEREVCE